jgi:hypothetical protein
VSSVDNLKKEAKRRLKAARTQNPSAPATLREVQHALAREHGHESWKAMLEAIERESPGGQAASPTSSGVFEFACWDHHIHGKAITVGPISRRSDCSRSILPSPATHLHGVLAISTRSVVVSRRDQKRA